LKGDTGVKLQYTHCRLGSLERNCGTILTSKCEPSLLQEDVVDELVILIAKFEEVVLKSYEELEPCILTVYLFNLRYEIQTPRLKHFSQLSNYVQYVYYRNMHKFSFFFSNAINKAFNSLRVKDELPDVASQRLLLFHVARNILAQGMKLLGLIPLEEM